MHVPVRQVAAEIERLAGDMRVYTQFIYYLGYTSQGSENTCPERPQQLATDANCRRCQVLRQSYLLCSEDAELMVYVPCTCTWCLGMSCDNIQTRGIS